MTKEQLAKMAMTVEGCQAQIANMLTALTAVQIEAKEYYWARSTLHYMLGHLDKAFVQLGDLSGYIGGELGNQSNGQGKA